MSSCTGLRITIRVPLTAKHGLTQGRFEAIAAREMLTCQRAGRLVPQPATTQPHIRLVPVRLSEYARTIHGLHSRSNSVCFWCAEMRCTSQYLSRPPHMPEAGITWTFRYKIDQLQPQLTPPTSSHHAEPPPKSILQ